LEGGEDGSCVGEGAMEVEEDGGVVGFEEEDGLGGGGGEGEVEGRGEGWGEEESEETLGGWRLGESWRRREGQLEARGDG